MLFAAFMLAISCAQTEQQEETMTTEEVTTEATEGDHVEGEVEEAVEEVHGTFDEMKGAFIAKVSPAIEEWNQKITDLETRKNNLPDLAQAPLEEPMTDLLTKRDAVGEQFTKVENATEETFDVEKTALETAFGDLDGAFNTIQGLFK